jgi:hypothetical protein
MGLNAEFHSTVAPSGRQRAQVVLFSRTALPERNTTGAVTGFPSSHMEK